MWKVAALLAGLAAAEESGKTFHGYVSSKEWLGREPVITMATGQELVADDELPMEFDWRNVGGVNYVTSDWNQHIPQYCGACWIHGTLSTLNDRIKVQRRGKFPDVRLGRQSIMNCVPDPKGKGPPPGCDGGDSYMIHKFLHETPMPDESCLPYQARNMGCTPLNTCRNCLPNGTCWAVHNFIGFGVSDYGNVKGEVPMMKEIYARGPIACSFAADDDFMNFVGENAVQHEGVYVTDKKYKKSEVDHVMEVAGWGETPSGMKYWVVRNSWGTYWGENGWIKIRRGVNQMLGEAECDWAVMEFKGLEETLKGVFIGDYVPGQQPWAKVAAGKALSAQAPPANYAPGSAGDLPPKPSSPDWNKWMPATFTPDQTAMSVTFDRGLGPRDFYVFFIGVAVTLAGVHHFGRRAMRETPLLG